MMLLGTLILGRPPFVFVDGLAKSTPAEASLFGSGYAGLGLPQSSHTIITAAANAVIAPTTRTAM